MAEAVADDAELSCAQHNMQKDARKKKTFRTPKGTEKQVNYILIKKGIWVAAETLKPTT